MSSDAGLARAAAEIAEAEQKAAAARCQAVEREAVGTADALEALLRDKERRLEEQPHLVDKRLVTMGMTSIWMD